MNTTIKLSSEEFNHEAFEKIRSLLAGKPGMEITISIHNLLDDRLAQAIDNVESGRNLTSYSLAEYEDFRKQLLNEE